MATVHLQAAGGGPAQMLADLIEANAEADPDRDRLLESARGAVQIHIRDAGATVGLKFVPGALTVTDGPVPGADLRIGCDTATLHALSTVPLRFGIPDPLSPGGRRVAGDLLAGRLAVRGGPGAPRMVRLLSRLLAVS